MALRVSSTYKTFIRVDGEVLKIRVKRLTNEEDTAFQHEFMRLGRLDMGEKLTLERRPGEENLKDEEVRSKRWVELSAEERLEREKAEREEAARGNAFALESIARYVTAEPDQIFDEDAGRYLTTGEELVRVFGARPDVLRDLVAEIYLQNRLGEEDKKKLLLLRASAPGWGGPATAAGEKPASTVESAGSEASAAREAATDDRSPSPSGSTGP